MDQSEQKSGIKTKKVSKTGVLLTNHNQPNLTT